MFGVVQDFLSRHRRKFFYTSLTIGGIVVAGKIAQRSFVSWQDKQMNQMMGQQKRKEHYEYSLEAARVAVGQILPNLNKVLESELNTNILIQAIKDQPEKKQQLWQQLKIVAFGKAVCTVVCSAFVTTTLHTMIMVIAATTLDENNDADQGKKVFNIQTKYFSFLDTLVNQELKSMVDKVMKITSNSLASLPLTRQLTLSQLEGVLQQVILSVTCNRNNNSEYIIDATDPIASCPVLPWSQYLKEPEYTVARPEDAKALHNLFLLTSDVLGTSDFNDVVNTVVQVGLNCLLDELATYYYRIEIEKIEKPIITSDTTNKASIINRCNVATFANTPEPSADVNQSDLSEIRNSNIVSIKSSGDETNLSSGYCSDSPQKNIETNNSANNVPEELEKGLNVTDLKSDAKESAPNSVSCPVVKLLSQLDRCLHATFLGTRNDSVPMLQVRRDKTFYNHMLVCSKLEAFSYLIYKSLLDSTKKPTQ